MPSIQGNSAGQVNIQEVVSAGEFLCGNYNTRVKTNEETKNHPCKKHDSASVAKTNTVLVNKDKHNNALNRSQSEDDGFNKECDEEETENAIIAQELENMVEKVRFLYKSDCHNCYLSKEVENHKDNSLNQKEAKIVLLENRVKKTDGKKNELQKYIKKVKIKKIEVKKELNICQDMLAECQKRISIMTVELATKENIAEISNGQDKDHQIKCTECDFNGRNSALMESHITLQHKQSTEHKCILCSSIYKTKNPAYGRQSIS